MRHRGSLTSGELSTLHRRIPRSPFPACGYDQIPERWRPHGGKRRWTGAPPLFAARCGRGGAAQFTFAQHPLGGSLPSQFPLAGRPEPWTSPTNDNADALERDSMKWRHAVLVLADAGAVIRRTRYDPRGGLGTHRALRGPIVRLASSLPCIIPPSCRYPLMAFGHPVP